ncbi:MAG: adenylate/guanylate cyclase domain-containing protein [Alphaproteobacteria bacterium]
MPAELTGEWTHIVNQPVAQVWPILSDTVRFNEMSGLPRYVLSETPQPDGSVRRVALGRVARYDLQWEELPVEWVAERYFFQRRLFLNGPLRHMDASLTLAPCEEGTKATYQIAIAARYPLLGPYVAGRLIRGAERTFAKAVQGADGFLSRTQAQAFELQQPVLMPGGESRAREITNFLRSGPYDHGLSDRIMSLVLRAPDADACRIRPRALARIWGVEQRHVIEICLAAVRSGLLRLTWDILCPRCRGAKASTVRLDLLVREAHCPSCNVAFDADFNKNVELTFHPAATLRECAAGEYCLSGPQTTPHVWLQQNLAAGETRKIAASHSPGAYRLRTLSPGPEYEFSYKGGGVSSMALTRHGLVTRDVEAEGSITLANETGRPQTFIIEDREWIKDALTAHQVTSLHTFRHLFPDQVLRSGEELSIDSVSLMFTDLQGSTALYREIGDGPAYQRVREHFEFLIDIVRAHDGALVKTIGDAVMAAFTSPQQAVRAALAVQEKISALNRLPDNTAIHIKIGLHYGRCIVVNLNERLDYFGTTVNLSARLQAQSRGGDIVLSEELASDPLVTPMLEGLSWTQETTTLKGFAQAISFRRISADV